MHIHVNEDIKCEHGYAYSAGQHAIFRWVNEDTWERFKNCFPDATQINMCPITVSCKECTLPFRSEERSPLYRILSILMSFNLA